MAQDYGIKISKDGFDVKVAAELDLVFTSKYKTFKVIASGSSTVNVSAGGNVTLTVTHNLGYRAGNLVYYNIGGNRILASMYAASENQSVVADAFCSDNNTLKVYIESLSSFSGDVPIRWYLFADPGQ